ncbi:DUF4136 domain-containing protein [uncultured Sphingomonas sp.]|uniref:DUF4136 domain-containing protein n=1 Tax=uncultured Sphingomonas sp. TaxID=158754 RepID=UPI0035CB7AA5
MYLRSIAACTVLLLGGCTTTGTSYSPVEVTRYHVDEVGRGTIAVVPESGAPDSLEFRGYAAAIADELGRLGYTVVPAGTDSRYLARVGMSVDRQTVRDRRSPISLGLGADSYSGGYRRSGVGFGGGISIPIGRARSRTATATMLSVRINERQGDLGVWEGRAEAREVGGAPADAGATTDKLARALFTGFPGESGRTIEVK